MAKSNVGVWSCGRQITGVISRLRAPDRKSWPRLGNWAVRGPSCNPPAGHCKRIRRVCFILHFTNTRQNKLPKWPPFRVEKVSPNRRNKGGWVPAPTVCGASPPPQSAGALSARLASRTGPPQPTGPVLLSHFSKLIDSTDPADCLGLPSGAPSPLPATRLPPS